MVFLGLAASPAVTATISVPRKENAAVIVLDQKARKCPHDPPTGVSPAKTVLNGPGLFRGVVNTAGGVAFEYAHFLQ
jgi:hypothetical protein